MSADDSIPMAVAAALAYGRLSKGTPTSGKELKELVALMVTALEMAIPAAERRDGQVEPRVLFEAIDRLAR